MQAHWQCEQLSIANTSRLRRPQSEPAAADERSNSACVEKITKSPMALQMPGPGVNWYNIIETYIVWNFVISEKSDEDSAGLTHSHSFICLRSYCISTASPNQANAVRIRLYD